MAEASDGSKQSQEFLSSVIKGVHSQLREEYVASGGQYTEIWSKHLTDSDTLCRYSSAMQSLATGPWKKKHASSRIIWCIDTIREYFPDCRLVHLLEKDLKRFEYGNPTLVELTLLPKSQEEIITIAHEFNRRPQLNVLDVGSCYNPFKEYKDYNVTAIDIAPATEDVVQCDFLSVDFSNGKDFTDDKSQFILYRNSFDVVVFSLLLSYFPSTRQRLLCCINAHQTLKLHGILLIITVDSSHQNRHVDMMKSWKNAIESIGFHRWKYEKDTHLHLMAFRKTRLQSDYDQCMVNFDSALFIPQDDGGMGVIPSTQ